MRPDAGDVLVSRIGLMVGVVIGIVAGIVGGTIALFVLSLVAIYVIHGIAIATQALDREEEDEG
jgi:uncharacterized membrane protein YoaK (UPF0700 family)